MGYKTLLDNNYELIKALLHYRLMIDWVESHSESFLNKTIDRILMFDLIGENWFSTSCSYCNSFFERDMHYWINHSSCFNFNNFRSCSKCPLSSYLHGCCNGLWNQMNNSNSWNEWLVYAKKIYSFINKKG